MTLQVIHRGHSLSQEQLDALVPVLNKSMRKRMSKKKFEEECDAALIAAGCPVPEEEGKENARL